MISAMLFPVGVSEAGFAFQNRSNSINKNRHGCLVAGNAIFDRDIEVRHSVNHDPIV